jgi:hypothetical protein
MTTNAASFVLGTASKNITYFSGEIWIHTIFQNSSAALYTAEPLDGVQLESDTTGLDCAATDAESI